MIGFEYITLIDHYDSFTFNVVEWLKSGASTKLPYQVKRIAYDDQHSMEQVFHTKNPVVFSPGPNRPSDVGPSIALCEYLIGRVPILGVCLGHQILGQIAGGSIGKYCRPFHGSSLTINFSENDQLYKNIDSPLNMAIYHSLSVQEPDKFKEFWSVNARDENGEIMGLVFREASKAPALGVQFHPESFLSQQADILLNNFLAEINSYYF